MPQRLSPSSCLITTWACHLLRPTWRGWRCGRFMIVWPDPNAAHYNDRHVVKCGCVRSSTLHLTAESMHILDISLPLRERVCVVFSDRVQGPTNSGIVPLRRAARGAKSRRLRAGPCCFSHWAELQYGLTAQTVGLYQLLLCSVTCDC